MVWLKDRALTQLSERRSMALLVVDMNSAVAAWFDRLENAKGSSVGLGNDERDGVFGVRKASAECGAWSVVMPIDSWAAAMTNAAGSLRRCSIVYLVALDFGC